ncbi:MAG: PilZ domain-containing protein [Sphingomonadaceae bacterium]
MMAGADEQEATNRKAPRDSLFLSSSIMVAGAKAPVTVRVRNLAPGGMMVDGSKVFYQNAKIMTDLRGIGEIEGRVVWATEDRAGIAFDETVDPKLARHPVVGRSEPAIYVQPVVDRSRRPGLKLRA